MGNITKPREKTIGARRFIGLALDGLFPRPCVACENDRDGEGFFLCASCHSGVRRIVSPICDLCGQPGEMDYDYPGEEFVCGLCRHEPYAFQQARSLGYYESALKLLIRHLKYRKQPGVMREIRLLLDDYFAQEKLDRNGFIIIPIPLFAKRMKERGFDQAFLIAKELAGILDLPVMSGLLTRVRDTPFQASLARPKRLENIKGSFLAKHPDQVKGRKILLVDDVLTTGSTCNEAAKILKQSKADCVHVFTLARAVKGRFSL